MSPFIKDMLKAKLESDAKIKEAAINKIMLLFPDTNYSQVCWGYKAELAEINRQIQELK